MMDLTKDFFFFIFLYLHSDSLFLMICIVRQNTHCLHNMFHVSQNTRLQGQIFVWVIQYSVWQLGLQGIMIMDYLTFPLPLLEYSTILVFNSNDLCCYAEYVSRQMIHFNIKVGILDYTCLHTPQHPFSICVTAYPQGCCFWLIWSNF